MTKADTKPKPEAPTSDIGHRTSKEKAAAPTLSVEKKGSYVYWFAFKDAEGVEQTSLPARFKGKSTELDLEPLGEKYSEAKLFVMNKTTGNLAISDYPASKETKDVDLPTDDFQYVRTVRLRVVAEDGKPVESAIVRITDGMSTKMTAVVTPADEGVATFQNVASGEMTVKVEAEGLRKTLDSDIEVPEKRAIPNYEQDVRVAGDVNTLPIKPKAAKGEAAERRGGGLSMILQTLAGLIVLALIIAIVVIWLKAKGVTAKSALQGLGVETPGGATAQTQPGAQQAPAIDPNVCQFCGQRKDANGRCACSITPGAAPVSTPTAAAAATGPRLVGSQGVYAGHVFEITSASMVIGREADNPIALPNDGTASRRHATITQSSDGCSIRDEGSSNGTFVNGARVTEQALSPGDEIQIGGTKFRFEV